MVTQILPAPPRKSNDFYALTLADAVWGGAATRLGENIREEKGHSYGVFSFPQLYSAAGMWRAFGTVQADKTKESMIEFLKELNFIAGEKPVPRSSRRRGQTASADTHSNSKPLSVLEARWGTFGPWV